MGELICTYPFNCTRFSKRQLIGTFVFLDLETTGLPSAENNKTKITEMCLNAVQSDHLTLGVFPRVQNKITLCFNPRKLIHPIASEVTGLFNDMLESQSEFTSETVDLIKAYLEMQSKPICFVAHNGNSFDYPILREHFNRLGNELDDAILCIDSLMAFRELHNYDVNLTSTSDNPNCLQLHQSTTDLNGLKKEMPLEFSDGNDDVLLQATMDVEKSFCAFADQSWSVSEIQRINETTPKRPILSNSLRIPNGKEANGQPINMNVKRNLFNCRVSFKLGDIYTRLTKKECISSHRAEEDVNMLIECAAKLGEIFVNWANLNSKRFNEIPMMQPGKKIGT